MRAVREGRGGSSASQGGEEPALFPKKHSDAAAVKPWDGVHPLRARGRIRVARRRQPADAGKRGADGRGRGLPYNYLMLPKQNRLNLKKSYSWVNTGKKLESSNFRLLYRLGNNSHPLIGIALSSRVFNKAVQRNRARRLISKAFEVVYQSLPALINIVASPKSGILNSNSSQITDELVGLLKKEGVVR